VDKTFLYNFVRNHNIRKSSFIGYSIAFSVIAYFLFFTIFGDKGLFTLFSLKKETSKIEITKQELLNKMHNKKNMVDKMSTDSLDLDLLDEQSRKVLGYAGKNEVVIYQDKAGENHESKD
jgi:cell division protein FtsB